MDMNDIELGTRGDAFIVEKNENENKGITNRCPVRSVSVGGNTRDYLYKKPYSYTRQNSINDSREYNELKDRKDRNLVNSKTHTGIHNPILKKPDNDNIQEDRSIKECYVRQISTISASKTLLEKDSSVTHGNKMTENVLIDREYNEKRGDYSDDACWNGRGLWRNGACICRMSGCACVLSILTNALMIFVLLKVSYLSDDQKQELATSMGLSRHGETTSDANVSTSGSFKINQAYLHDHKRIIWIKDENSEIIPSSKDDCLTVPHSGKYLVVSRFTFNILPGDATTTITHFFKLKTRSGLQKDGGYKRKYVSVLENNLRTGDGVQTNLELRKPSVFIEFFDLDAYDQVCPNVSSPNLLYESRMDNDVNIIRV